MKREGSVISKASIRPIKHIKKSVTGHIKVEQTFQIMIFLDKIEEWGDTI